MESGLHIDVHWTSKGRVMPTGLCHCAVKFLQVLISVLGECSILSAISQQSILN